MELQDRVVEHIPRLRRYARALLRGDSLAADDLVQDCLERALSRMHHWRRGSDLRAWLFTIMHNVYVNQVRRSVDGPQFIELAEDDPPAATAAGVESGVALDELQNALGGLSPDQREILLLVTLEGLRYQEVATILGIPEGTVMSRLSRARQQLRKALARDTAPSLRRIK
ncbi:sigma-70 family RNA polymerase sigma factor [Endothiovibrio diazotrophicus]